jgi:hypothetical protein
MTTNPLPAVPEEVRAYLVIRKWELDPTGTHPGIYIDDPEGGDPICLAQIARLFHGELLTKALTPSPNREDELRAEIEPRYLVWSNEHQAWWGRDRCGYTRIISRAGRYDRAEALSIAGTRDGGWHVRKGNPDEIAIPEQDAIDQYAGITAAQELEAAAVLASEERTHG